MKTRKLYTGMILAVLLALAACTGASTDPYRRLTILHTTDEHSYQLGVGPEVDDYPPALTPGNGEIIGGTGRRASLFARERAKAELQGAACLTFSSGDNMMGTLFEAASIKAAPDYRAMSLLGYDAGTFGNHDFELSPGFLAAAIAKAREAGRMFPFVATNIHFSGTPADAPLSALFDEAGTDPLKPIKRWHVITATNGLKIGLIGIMGGHAAYDAPGKYPVTFTKAPSGKDEDFDGIVDAICEEVQPVVDCLRTEKKVDLVIALGHTGTDPEKPERGESYRIARNVSGIDIFLSGHTHLTVAPMRVRNVKTGRDVILIESGRYGDHVGKLSLLVDRAGNVTMDDRDSGLIPVDSSIPWDPALQPIVDESIRVLESTPEGSGTSTSMLERTLSAIEGKKVSDDPAVTGDLYFRLMGKTHFPLPLVCSPTETPLMRLVADSLLSIANTIRPTRVSLNIFGITRDGIWKGKGGSISFADVFRIFPTGQSPLTPGIGDYSAGFPVARFAMTAIELRAILEATLPVAFASTEGIDRFIVPAGLRYEFDTDRTSFDPTDPLNPQKGWVTKMLLASDPTNPEVFDTTIFDTAAGGWLINPTTMYTVAVNYNLALFAESGGIKLRNPDNPAEIYPSPVGAVMKRPDGSEQKAYEALATYIMHECQANGGYLPARYADEKSHRVICKGLRCVRP